MKTQEGREATIFRKKPLILFLLYFSGSKVAQFFFLNGEGNNDNLYFLRVTQSNTIFDIPHGLKVIKIITHQARKRHTVIQDIAF